MLPRRHLPFARLATIATLVLALSPSTQAADTPPALRFEAQELDPHVGNVCYAVTTADVNGDGKLDVVAVTEDAVVWFENPMWQKHEIVRGATALDNVCIAAHDIDGDGHVDFALGAGWRPTDTTGASTLQWLGRDADGQWQMHPIRFAEPTLHRIRWGDVASSGKLQLVVVPLQGRGTKGPNWGDGSGVKIQVFTVPDDPQSPDWPADVADDSLHTTHNFQIQPWGILVAAWEGVFELRRDGHGHWTRTKLGEGYQAAELANKGASEIKFGQLVTRAPVIATIEPWHGRQVVLYEPEEWTLYEPFSTPFLKGPWNRRVLDDGVMWGHAVWIADLDGEKGDELIVGQRDPRTDEKQPKGPGVWVYQFTKSSDGSTPKPVKVIVDDGGMACEDALAADLDGDGRPDIVAGGRATHNVKIYWNKTPKPDAAR
jgi:hypothetical protein